MALDKELDIFFFKCCFHTPNHFYVWFYWWMACIMHILRIHIHKHKHLRICKRALLRKKTLLWLHFYFSFFLSLCHSLRRMLCFSSFSKRCVCVSAFAFSNWFISGQTYATVSQNGSAFTFVTLAKHTLTLSSERKNELKDRLSNERAPKAKQNELFVDQHRPSNHFNWMSSNRQNKNNNNNNIQYQHQQQCIDYTHMLIVISIENRLQTNAGLFAAMIEMKLEKKCYHTTTI